MGQNKNRDIAINLIFLEVLIIFNNKAKKSLLPINNMLTKDLIEFGFTEKEAKVYLALLALEIAPVSEIAKSAVINRSTAYVILESLKRKGYVSTSDDKNVQKFIATDPEVLLRTAEKLADKIADVTRQCIKMRGIRH